jgi:hypothetical protein
VRLTEAIKNVMRGCAVTRIVKARILRETEVETGIIVDWSEGDTA